MILIFIASPNVPQKKKIKIKTIQNNFIFIFSPFKTGFLHFHSTAITIVLWSTKGTS